MSRHVFSAIAVLFFVAFTSRVAFSQAIIDGFINNEGRIFLEGGPPTISGYQIFSNGGYLVPVAGGPDPFDTFVANSNKSVAASNISGIPTSFAEGFLTFSFWNPPPGVLASIDLTGSCGSDGDGCEIHFSDVVVPEPSVLSMIALPMLGMMSLRRKRKK